MNTVNDKVYKFGYNLLISAFDEDNPDLGVLNALQLIQQCFQAKEVSIYRIENNKIINDYSYPNDDYDFVTKFFNSHKNLLSNRVDYDFKLNDKIVNRLTWFTIENNKYMLVIINGKFRDNIVNNLDVRIITKSLEVILKKERMIENLIKSSTIDGLTGLDNRLSFNKKIIEYNKNNKYLTFTIFDLFSLKDVNDSFGHMSGDLYIKGSADILKKYFPKYRYNFLTGDSIYRIGGDEFVLISEKKKIDDINRILIKVKDDIRNLEIDEQALTDINYGIAERDNNQSLEELYSLADSKLSDDKRLLYEKLHKNRRR